MLNKSDSVQETVKYEPERRRGQFRGMILVWRKDVSELHSWFSMFISIFLTCTDTVENGQPWHETKSVMRKSHVKDFLSLDLYLKFCFMTQCQISRKRSPGVIPCFYSRTSKRRRGSEIY